MYVHNRFSKTFHMNQSVQLTSSNNLFNQPEKHNDWIFQNEKKVPLSPLFSNEF